MFQFTGYCVPSRILFGEGRRALARQVTPFGNLRVIAKVQLTGAYRSLSRPSSPVSTKAFTVCP